MCFTSNFYCFSILPKHCSRLNICIIDVLLLQVIAIDMNREAYEVGLPFIQKAGVEHKIEFVEGTALQILNDLLKNVCMTHF